MADLILPQSKICKVCGQDKPLSAFERNEGNRGGYTPRCKECLNEAKRRARAIQRALTPPTLGKIVDGQKQCRVCGEHRLVSDFYSQGTRAGGGPATCKPCISEQRRQQYAKEHPAQPLRVRGDERICLRCNCWKPLNAFFVKKNGFGNRAAVCKECMAQDEVRSAKAAMRAKRWVESNPERASINARLSHNRRRVLKRNAAGKHTAADIRRLHQLQRGRCACCRDKLAKYHIDHRMPLARGGSNDWHNLQLLCPTCNLRKSAKDPIEHARELGRLL